MREQFIEKKFTDAVKKMGGIAPKFVSPGLDGVPDRLVLLPMGRMAFVEFKAPGKKMRPLQIRRKKQLESLGFKVFCVDSIEQIGGVIDAIQSPMNIRLTQQILYWNIRWRQFSLRWGLARASSH